MPNDYLVEMVSIDTIIPYARNPRNNKNAVDGVAASIKEYGFRQPIVVDAENVIVVGHTRLLAAQKLGLTEVPIHRALNLTPQQIKAYRIADNKTHEAAEWDYDLLSLEVEEIGDLFTGFTEKEFNDLYNVGNDKDPYTAKIDGPIYEPQGLKPSINKLVDKEKVNHLISEIDQSSLSDDIKTFLRIAATRHYKFDYSSIAEFYCHSSKEVQDLMEKSALIIIDFDKAIEYGYVKLTNELADVYEESLKGGK